jgi:hypothetical protein
MKAKPFARFAEIGFVAAVIAMATTTHPQVNRWNNSVRLFSDSDFSDISPGIVIPGTGATTTNYVDLAGHEPNTSLPLAVGAMT